MASRTRPSGNSLGVYALWPATARSGAAAAALLVLMCSPAAGVTSLSEWQQGIATNYGGAADGLSPDQPSFGTSVGSCGYGVLDKNTWPFWSVGALSVSSSFFSQGPIEACGQCFEIQCLDQGGAYAGRCNMNNPVSVVVQIDTVLIPGGICVSEETSWNGRSPTLYADLVITDKCPECLANQIDMQALTFNKLAPMAIGRIDIQYRRVECVPPAPMVVFVDNNNGPGSWLRLFIEQSGGQAAIAAVQVRTSGSAANWQNMRNVFGSDWEIPQSPSYPLDISIVGPDGQTVTAFNVINSTGQIGDFPTSAQFHITNPTDNLLSFPVGTSGSGSPATPSVLPEGPSPPGNQISPGNPAPPTTVPTAPVSVPKAMPPAAFMTYPSPPTTSEPVSLPPGAAGQESAQSPPSSPPVMLPPSQSSPPPPPAGVTPPAAMSPPVLPVNRNPCGSCFDHSTPVFSCAQQVGWGQCQQPWMLAGDQSAPEGFCALSCGRCTCP